jgi:alpha/beta superfamily hydrolase
MTVNNNKSPVLDVFLNGDVGRLHIKYQHGSSPSSPSVLILHPDTRCGGNADNNVVRLLAETFSSIGFSVVRLNFRGAGRSDGKFDGNEEVRDAAIALDWLRSQNVESSHFWIVGFSFGTWIGANLMMRRPEIEGFVFLSPFISEKHNFTFLAPCPASGLIVYGENDKIVSEGDVGDIVTFLNNQNENVVDYIKIANASHNFANCDEKLKEEVDRYVNMILAMRVPKPVRKKRRRRKKKDSII